MHSSHNNQHENKSNRQYPVTTTTTEEEKKYKQQFEKDGYIVIPGLIPVELLREWQILAGCYSFDDDDDDDERNDKNKSNSSNNEPRMNETHSFLDTTTNNNNNVPPVQNKKNDHDDDMESPPLPPPPNKSNNNQDTLLDWLLDQLYENGHTQFREEWQLRPRRLCSKNEKDDIKNTNHCHTKAGANKKDNDDKHDKSMMIREYAMGQGVKHGFREIVMRSPGRYELSLLNNSKLFWPEKQDDPLLLTTPEKGCNAASQASSSSGSGTTTTNHATTRGSATTTQCQIELQSTTISSSRDADSNSHDTTKTSTPTTRIQATPRMPDLQKIYNLLAKKQIPLIVLNQSSWDKVHISNVLILTATPGAVTQGWHADGGHVNLQHHDPCHVANIFVALHAIPNRDGGPTQVRPGTQVHTRNLGPMLLAAHCRKTLAAPQTILMQPGDALIFDYRLLHRGLAKKDNTDGDDTNGHRYRSLLVITIAQEWFRDRLNFPKRSLFETKSNCN